MPDSASHRDNSQFRLRIMILPGLLVLYALLPIAALKLFVVIALLWLIARGASGLTVQVLLAGFVVFVFASAFLLNPVSHFLPEQFADARHDGIWKTLFGGATWLLEAIENAIGMRPATALQILFGLVGSWWAYMALGRTGPVRLWRMVPGPFYLFIWLGCVVSIYQPGWSADVALAGDEAFHMRAVVTAQEMMKQALGQPVAVVLILGWLGAGAVLAMFGANLSEAPRRKGICAWAASGLVMAALLVPGIYGQELMDYEYVEWRAARFPAAQPWCSAVLSLAGTVSENGILVASSQMLRLLPVMALAMIGMCLGADRRWRRLPPLVAVLAATVVVTIPNLLYHGTILYLELPLLLLSGLVLADVGAWLTLPLTRLRLRLTWWPMILLGFTKETALPIILVILGLRALVRIHRRLNGQDRGPFNKWLRDELVLGAVVLGPLVLYMITRQAFGSRPYGGEFANLMSIEMWLGSAKRLVAHTGPVLVPALYGIWIMFRAGRRLQVAALLTLLVALQAFLLSDTAEFIGNPRFNLLFLPPIIIFAWEGMTGLVRAMRPVAIVAMAILLAANLWLSPVSFRGPRAPWSGAGERWYPFTECLADIGEKDPDARVLLANMTSLYDVAHVFRRLQWAPRAYYQTSPPAPDAAVREPMEFALTEAAKRQCTVVIYQCTSDNEFQGQYPNFGGYSLTRRYPAAAGGLLVFERVRADVRHAR